MDSEEGHGGTEASLNTSLNANASLMHAQQLHGQEGVELVVVKGWPQEEGAR